MKNIRSEMFKTALVITAKNLDGLIGTIEADPNNISEMDIAFMDENLIALFDARNAFCADRSIAEEDACIHWSKQSKSVWAKKGDIT